MIQTLIKNWWLLALCGVLDAIISIIYLVMYDAGPDGPLTFHGWSGTVASLSTLALVAGACTIAAGIWRSASGKSWLLVMNGLAFRTMVLWLDRCGLGWFCSGVSCFGESLDSTGTQAFSPFGFPVALRLLRVQRSLYAGAGTALAQRGSFPIRPVERLAGIRKSKTRTLSSRASRYTTTGTSFDSMMRWSDVTRRRRSTRAVATMARSAGSRRLPNEATSTATSYVNGRIWKTPPART